MLRLLIHLVSFPSFVFEYNVLGVKSQTNVRCQVAWAASIFHY